MDERCLAFHETKRSWSPPAPAGASEDLPQSVERWRNYENSSVERIERLESIPLSGIASMGYLATLAAGPTILALVLSLTLLWSVSHHYLGLGGDARLYAVQALPDFIRTSRTIVP